MQRIKQFWLGWTMPVLAMASFTIWYCDPGESLNPQLPSVPVAKITFVNSLPHTPMQPGDTGSVSVSITDSSNGNALTNASLSISSADFSLIHSDSSKVFSLASVPASGAFSFRIVPRNNGIRGRISITAGSGAGSRSVYDTITVSEKPVLPFLEIVALSQIGIKDSSLVTITVKDSAGNKLQNAIVEYTSTFFSLFKVASTEKVLKDTTRIDGKVMFRLHSNVVGTGTVGVSVTTAAGLQTNATITTTVTNIPVNDRPRTMSFVALKPTLRADGSDSTPLRVVVKDAATSTPLDGESIVFTSTGGLVSPSASTDTWGTAFGLLKSERANKSVIVTATMVRTGTSAQQTVTFSGINISISTSKRVIMRDSIVDVVFTLTDANGSPMSGDTLELVGTGLYKGFGQRLPGTIVPSKDSILVAVDTRGQYKTTVTSRVDVNATLDARALGARALDTVTFTSKSLNFSASKASILGNGLDQTILTATLFDGNMNGPIKDAQLRWTTTFGNFTSTPFTSTDGSGKSSITLRSPKGSGLAFVNVEARSSSGVLIASGNIVIRVTSLPVHRLVLSLSPDNIPVKIGETKLTAKAYDSADNVMSDVLIGFRMIKGAGGGDEVISPPAAYSQAGAALSSFRAGGTISLYQGVKLSAVALDIVGTDTLIIGSSDTVGLTISGPPSRVSIGVNILKGLNPNDGTFALPTAAVVTDVNGNLVADGTPVNFSVIPIAAHFPKFSFRYYSYSGSYTIDTVYETLPWTDYNNNGKLDNDEPFSKYNPKNPARGEDRDGNGVINFPPESFEDINQNGIWDSVDAEPRFTWFHYYDTTNQNGRYDTVFVDYNRNGKWDSKEPFYDYNKDGKCQCAGTYDAKANLYEGTYFGSTANHPFPGEVSVGIDRQIGSLSGKALTKITYVQSDAIRVSVRITSESNGVRSTTDVWLPVIKD